VELINIKNIGNKMDKKLDLIAFSPMADIGFWSTLAKVQRLI